MNRGLHCRTLGPNDRRHFRVVTDQRGGRGRRGPARWTDLVVADQRGGRDTIRWTDQRAHSIVGQFPVSLSYGRSKYVELRCDTKVVQVVEFR